MSSPQEIHKLARGVGRLIRYRSQSPWIWQHWSRTENKWITTPTKEYSKTIAEQFAYQQVSLARVRPHAARKVRTLFATVAEDYFTARQHGRECKKLRSSSLRKVKTAINIFRAFMGGRYQSLVIEKLDADLLIRFRNAERKRTSALTANTHLMILLQIIQYGKRCGLIETIPVVSRISDDVTNPNNGITGSGVPNRYEIQQILEAARIEHRPTGERRRDGRRIYSGVNANDYSALFRTLCYTGMRIGEAIHLTWADIDLKNKVILIQSGDKNGSYWEPKTKHGHRRIAVVPELETILVHVHNTNRNNNWVFESKRGTQLQACNIQKKFRNICDELEFETRYTVHSLRKYWASTVAQQGMPWQVMIKMFGHGDFRLILETYYAQNDDARLVAEIRKIDFGLCGDHAKIEPEI